MPIDEVEQEFASGEAAYCNAYAAGLRPDADITVSQWAEQKRILAQGASARPGRWRNDTAPYLTEIMDCLSPSHPATRVVFKKSSQIGGTEIGINWLGYIAEVSPADTGYYVPSDNVARILVRDKVNRMIEATPTVRRSVKPQTSRDETGSSIFSKALRGGGSIQFLGVNASSNLQTFTFKNLIKDELTEWPMDVEGRGDPDPQADARTKSYAARGRKIFEPSTPGIKGACRISKKYEDSDQRRYFVPCPDCGHMQTLDWPRLQFNETKPYDAHYACSACGVLIPHHKKLEMIRKGKWIAQKPGEGREPGFQLNQLYSVFIGWDDTVDEFVKAKGDARKEKTFTQQALGEEYEEQGDAPDDERLFARRERYKLRRIPPGALILTGAVDVQSNRLEYAVYAWDRHGTSWLIDVGIIAEDPHEERAWRYLLEITQRRYEDAWGRMWSVDQWGVDSGYLSPRVYQFVRVHPMHEHIKALDGRSGEGIPSLGSPSKVDVDPDGKRSGKVMLWPVGTWGIKSDLYASLRKTIIGPDAAGIYPAGTAHYPEACDKIFFQQLTAEHFRLRERTNALPVPEWVKKKGQPNEQHDLAVYCRALYRWVADSCPENEWKERETARLMPPEREQKDFAEVWSGPPTAPPPVEEQMPAPQEEFEESSNLDIDDIVGPPPDFD